MCSGQYPNSEFHEYTKHQKRYWLRRSCAVSIATVVLCRDDIGTVRPPKRWITLNLQAVGMQATCYVVFSVELNDSQARLVRPWSVGVGVAAAVLLSHQLHIGYDRVWAYPPLTTYWCSIGNAETKHAKGTSLCRISRNTNHQGRNANGPLGSDESPLLSFGVPNKWRSKPQILYARVVTFTQNKVLRTINMYE